MVIRPVVSEPPNMQVSCQNEQMPLTVKKGWFTQRKFKKIELTLKAKCKKTIKLVKSNRLQSQKQS